MGTLEWNFHDRPRMALRPTSAQTIGTLHGDGRSPERRWDARGLLQPLLLKADVANPD